jgi:PAS fold
MTPASAAVAKQKGNEEQQREVHLAQQPHHSRIGNWEWHLLTKKYSWCDEMYRIFNLPPQRFALRTGSFFNCVHPDDREKVVRAFGKALVGEQRYHQEYRIVWPDGTVRIVQGKAEVRFDKIGRPISMSGTIRDITPFRQSERPQL